MESRSINSQICYTAFGEIFLAGHSGSPRASKMALSHSLTARDLVHLARSSSKSLSGVCDISSQSKLKESLQWPLSYVPNVAIVKRFHCKIGLNITRFFPFCGSLSFTFKLFAQNCMKTPRARIL